MRIELQTFHPALSSLWGGVNYLWGAQDGSHREIADLRAVGIGATTSRCSHSFVDGRTAPASL